VSRDVSQPDSDAGIAAEWWGAQKSASLGDVTVSFAVSFADCTQHMASAKLQSWTRYGLQRDVL
jgi:hypothetical protein